MKNVKNMKSDKNAVNSTRRSALLSLLVIAIATISLTGCFTSDTVFPETPPSLMASTGSQQSMTVINGYRWPSSDNAQLSKIEEPWPPVLPTYPLFLMPEDSITFLFEGFDSEPESVNIQVLDTHFAGPQSDPAEPLDSAILEDFEVIEDKGVSWAWVLPLLEPMPAGDPRRTLRIEATWTQPEEATAVYFVALSYAEAGSVQEACDEALGHFNNQCDGSQASLLALLPANIKAKYEDLNSYSFKLISEPETRVRSFQPDQHDVIYSEVDLFYSIESTHKPTGKSIKWDFRDGYTIRRKNSAWCVIWVTESSTPWAFDDGREPGWEVALKQTTLPDDHGTMVKMGPFTWVRYYDSMLFSDDGEYLAFAADNFSKKEIWIASRDGSGLKRVLSIPAPEGVDQWLENLQIIGWAPTQPTSGNVNQQTGQDSLQYKIRFIYSGYQTTEPYNNGTGYWLGEVDCDSGEIRDVAFISNSRMIEPRDIVVCRQATCGFPAFTQPMESEFRYRRDKSARI